jgi:carbamoylphosphate synthase small subunit
MENQSGLVELLLEVCFNTGMTGYQEILPILLIMDS